MIDLAEVAPGEVVSAEKVGALIAAVKAISRTRANEPVRLLKAEAGWVLEVGGKWVEIFFDDFNTENGGEQAANWDAFANWTVYLNFVDVIASTPGNPTGGDGLFVDMQGTTGDTTPDGPGFLAGIRTTVNFTTAGKYRLSWRMSGSQRGANTDVTVSVGTAYNEVFNLLASDDWQVYRRTFTVNGNGGAIQIANRVTNQSVGTVDRGALIDNVKLERFE